MISLLTFIRTGRLGAIGLGSTRTEVEAAFGPAPDWDAASQRESAQIWKYGAMEIYFDADRVWMIFTDDLRAPLHMGALAFEANGINGRISATDGEDWLRSNGVAFERESWPWCEEGVRLATGSGVTLTFGADAKGEPSLLLTFSIVRR